MKSDFTDFRAAEIMKSKSMSGAQCALAGASLAESMDAMATTDSAPRMETGVLLSPIEGGSGTATAVSRGVHEVIVTADIDSRLLG